MSRLCLVVSLVMVIAACSKSDTSSSKPSPSSQGESTAPATNQPDRTVAAPTGVAPSSGKAKPTAQQYNDSIAAGRELVKAGDFENAIARFKSALGAQPGDPVALTELGWAAFQADDLDQALNATERAVAKSAGTDNEATALANLGRIAEKKGDNPKAIDAYEKSLALHQDAEISKRLAALKKAN